MRDRHRSVQRVSEVIDCMILSRYNTQYYDRVCAYGLGQLDECCDHTYAY